MKKPAARCPLPENARTNPFSGSGKRAAESGLLLTLVFYRLI